MTDPYVASYAYVGNHPTSCTDPSGRTPICSDPFGLPDAVPGLYDFVEACTNHDYCYQNCLGTKGECDDGFLGDMWSSCEEGGYPAECYVQAVAYYLGVHSILGLETYIDYCGGIGG